jgi:chromosome segregation ATPase
LSVNYDPKLTQRNRFQSAEARLSTLNLEMEAVHRDLEHLLEAKSRSHELSLATLRKISDLETKLAGLESEYRSLEATIRGCQSKQANVSEQVCSGQSHTISIWDNLLSEKTVKTANFFCRSVLKIHMEHSPLFRIKNSF